MQGSTAGADSAVAYNSSTETYTFTIGQNSDGSSRATNRGELYNEISSALTNYSGSDTTAVAKLKVNVPAGTSTSLSSIATSGQLAGGVNEQEGSYSFDITGAIKEAGDTITVGGQTFTVVQGSADATKDQFSISGTSATITGGSEAMLAQANQQPQGVRLWAPQSLFIT
ncbi:hypothetical protein [Desulfosporosinus sp. SB140]|uniref:hypothetical protein n=1 Tax=Desulfosporosinus paludis TaxID=3115649 RepID=UPI003890B459